MWFSPWMLTLVACAPSEDEDPVDPDPTDTTPTETDDTGSPLDTGEHTGVTTPVDFDQLTLNVDSPMVLSIHATFDPGPATEAWVEYRFEGDTWLVAPTIEDGVAVILGIPELTEVEARAARVIDGKTVYTDPATATTGAVPPFVLRPTVNAYDPALAIGDPYLMTSVSTGLFTFEGPYVLEIYDRQGRIVWFRVVPDELFSFYGGPVRDGTHIWYDGSDIFGFASGPPHVTRSTLDGRQLVEVATPNAGQAIAEGPDDTFLYELRSANHGVVQLDAAGGSTLVWDCDAHMRSIGRDPSECLLNACTWDEARGSITASQFETSTVFEVDFATGDTLRQFGQMTEGSPYTFDPPSSMFAYQHGPHWTPEGTLLVSTHQPCGSQPGCYDNNGRNGIQVAAEYEVDDSDETITLIWSHTSTDLWATQAGEAWRLPNGNFIQGYGQDGAAREITADGETAFEVHWGRDIQGFRMVGRTTTIADLYALNQGF